MGSQELKVGESVPDLTVTDHRGATFRLSELWQRGGLVVYFYPKDDTPGCTKEACAFRDAYETFSDAGVEVVGVSGDSEEAHQRFSERHRLPFRLVSDGSGEIRRTFVVPKSFGFLPGRVTYVIDKAGVLRHRFNSQLRVEQHVSESLRALGAG